MSTSIRTIASFASAVCILAVAASEARAGVIKVAAGGGGAFGQIAAAVASASDGDVILVESGSYKRFTIDDKSLVIHADVSASVSVTGTITVENLAAGKSVVLRGLNVPGSLAISLDALVLQDDAGFVRIEDGSFYGAPGGFDQGDGHTGAVVTNSASIAFDRCTLVGGKGQEGSEQNFPNGGAALQATDSSVVACDVILLGGKGAGGTGQFKGVIGGSGGDAARIDGGRLFASGSQLTGGDGGFAYTGGSGGDGLVLAGGARASLLGDALLGGTASYGFGSPGSPGVPIDSAGGFVVTLDDTPRHFSATSPSREGDLIVFQCGGLPDEAVFLLYSLQAGQQTLGASKGTLLLGSPVQRLLLGNTDGTGAETFSSVVPELGLGVDALSFHCQALFAGTGGGPVLAGTSIELLLDGAP